MAVAAARERAAGLAELSLLKRIELLHRAAKSLKRGMRKRRASYAWRRGKPMQQAISEASPVSGYSWSNFHVATANVKTHRGLTLPNVTEDNQ